MIRMIANRVGSRAQDGFIMLMTLGALVFTTILITAMFLALQGDVHQTQHSLDGKNAYASAQAGLNAYLYQLNQNPNWWETCGNDTQAATTIPSSNPAQSYSWAPIFANGAAAATCAANPINALIDNATGSLRMVFTGYAGGTAGVNQVKRSIVASFRKRSPLDYLWYTVYESLDSAISGLSDCGVWYRAGRAGHCNINWVSGDVINGPMYTDDQYLISGSPVFGRAGDTTASLAPGTGPNDICSGSNCGGATFNGPQVWAAPPVPIPTDNSGLLPDATTYGKVFSGTTTITLNALPASTATVVNCPTAVCTTSTVDLTLFPIIYVVNAPSCTPPGYSPFGATYSSSGCAGDVYVKGFYQSPVTIAAANNIIINGSITTNEDGSGNPIGGATLGLAANKFVRVQHGCSGGNNVAGQTFANLKIDAAILALVDSFIVDNFDCGAAIGNLNVDGALVQQFRGAVGTFGSGTTGYLKQYRYDTRLSYLLPPYLFDIETGGWKPVRQTLCVPGGSVSTTAC